jgi:hypothetical protein
VLVSKRARTRHFPLTGDGVMRLNSSQSAVLAEGLGWTGARDAGACAASGALVHCAEIDEKDHCGSVDVLDELGGRTTCITNRPPVTQTPRF